VATDSERLTTDYCGLKLKNPVIMGPCGLSEFRQGIRLAREAGAAAIVMKTLCTGTNIVRRRPSPHFALVSTGVGHYKSTSLYSYEHPNELEPDEYFEELKQAKKEAEQSHETFPIFASIQCFDSANGGLSTWQNVARQAETAGADGIELNLSLPMGHPTRFLGMWAEGEMAKIVAAVKEVVPKTPLIVKLSSQMSRLLDLVLALASMGTYAFVCFNRIVGLDFNISPNRSPAIMHKYYAGYGGAWTLQSYLAHVCAIKRHLAEKEISNVQICASGGIVSGEDVVKYLLAGASVTQICSIVYLEGYGAISRILKELDHCLKSRALTVDSLIGEGEKDVLEQDQIVNEVSPKIAYINLGLCTATEKCKCKQSCPRQAIDVDLNKGKASIKSEMCNGCGLCLYLFKCPHEAFGLVGK